MGPFIGRKAELSAVRGLADRVRATRGPAVALFVSDPGQGKTRFLAEARASLGLTRALSVVGYEPERLVPLAATSELRRRLGSAEPRQAELAAEDRAGVPDLLEPVRMFEGLVRALDRDNLTLITIDDVQWVDELSLALLHYLVRGAVDLRRPVLVLAAGRPSEAAARLERSLGALLSEDSFVVATLAPLDASDAERLLDALIPGIGPEHAAAIVREAAGSPFWLEALAQSDGRPADIADQVDSRMSGAGSDTARLLSVLAVLGRPAAPGDLAAIAGWDERRVEAAASDLADRGVAVRDGGSVRLSHDLVRSAVHSEVPEAERRRVHSRIADVIERKAGDDVQLLRSALEHRSLAGRPALDLALRLARSPRRRWLGREGAAALAAIADEADQALAETAGLRRAVAVLASELADHDLAYRQWTLAAAGSTGADRARAALSVAWEAYRLGRPAVAARSLDEARALADPATSAGSDVLEALIEMWVEHRSERGRDLAERGLARARALHEAADASDAEGASARRTYLAAIEAAATAALQVEDFQALRRLVDEWLAASTSDSEAHSEALVMRAISLRLDGLFRDAVIPLEAAWATGHRLVLPTAAVHAGHWLATTLADLGELEEAERIAHEAGTMAARVGDYARVRVRSRSVQHEIALLRGDWRAAAEALLAAAQRVQDPHARVAFHQMLAAWLSILGGPSQAPEVRAQIAEAERLVRLAACHRCQGELELYSAEAFARTGQRAAAAAALEAWQHGNHRPEAWNLVQLQRLEGLLPADDTDRTAAPNALRAAIEQSEGLGRRLEAVIGRLDLGRALLASDRIAAATALREAGAAAAAIGAHTLAAAAERELRELGVRTWRRGATAPLAGNPVERLTGREREVALLVATGLSNPEIADRLFVSRKTVERHVSNALARLGAANRTELAGMIREAGPSRSDGPAGRSIEGPPR